MTTVIAKAMSNFGSQHAIHSGAYRDFSINSLFPCPLLSHSATDSLHFHTKAFPIYLYSSIFYYYLVYFHSLSQCIAPLFFSPYGLLSPKLFLPLPPQLTTAQDLLPNVTLREGQGINSARRRQSGIIQSTLSVTTMRSFAQFWIRDRTLIP